MRYLVTRRISVWPVTGVLGVKYMNIVTYADDLIIDWTVILSYRKMRSHELVPA